MTKSCIGEVCNCFGSSTKGGWVVFPSHGEHKWDCYKWDHAWSGRECSGQLWRIPWGKVDPLEAITDVSFVEEDGTSRWYREEDVSEQVWECVFKLHGFIWSKWEGIVINTQPRVISNPTWPVVLLGNDSPLNCIFILYSCIKLSDSITKMEN